MEKPAKIEKTAVNVDVLLSTKSTQQDFDDQITKVASMHYDRYASLRFSIYVFPFSLSLSLSLSVKTR